MQAFEVNDMDGLVQKQPMLGRMPPTTHKILLWGFGILVFIIVMGAILGFSIIDHPGSGSNVKYSGDDVCHTEDCIRTSEALRASMNMDIDPCDDFYEFACGNWKSKSSSSVTSSVNDKIYTDLVGNFEHVMGQNILEHIDDNDIDAVQQAKLFYQSCMDFDFSDYKKYSQLQAQNDILPYRSRRHRNEDYSDWVQPKLKSRNCIWILYLFDAGHFALMHKYLLRHVTNRTFSDTKEQFINIGVSYRNLISRLVWMDKSTKEPLIAKSSNMTLHFGRPEWLSNHNAVSGCYQGLRLMNGSLLDNTAIVKEWREKQDKQNAGNRPCNFKEFRRSKWFLQRVLGESNRFFFKVVNGMVVPFPALMQPPYARNGLRAADYGALGTEMGHGLIDGFGSAADFYEARSHSTWSSDTLRAFLNRTSCFIDQNRNTRSSVFHEHGIDPYLKMSDEDRWENTINNNVAGNGGVLIAFQAYQLYLSRLGKAELKLPGMEDYTPEQIFFLSYAHILCSSKGSPEEKKFPMELIENKWEIVEVLSNSEEFASAWNCRRPSRMDPDKKCLLWE